MAETKPNLSLAELDALNDAPPAPEKTPPAGANGIEGGTGAKPPENLEEAQKLAKEQAEAQKKLDDEAAEKAEAEKVVARVAELKAKETRTTEEQAELDELEPPAEEGDFWTDVDKIRGEEVKIDWEKIKDEAGNPIDPMTPRGAYEREKIVVKNALEKWEKDLATGDPRGYQYLLHREKGGSDEDFFNNKTTTLPDYEAFKESVDLRTKLYTSFLIDKGIAEDEAKLLVDTAVKNKTLDAKSDAAYKTMEAKEKADIEALEKELKDRDTVFNNSLNTISKQIEEEIKGKNMSIIVPDAKKVEFSNYLRAFVEYDAAGNRWLISQPLTKDTMPKIMEALYFQFVKGNMGDLVKREAAHQNATRLKRSIDATKTAARGGAPADTGGKKNLTVGEI